MESKKKIEKKVLPLKRGVPAFASLFKDRVASLGLKALDSPAEVGTTGAPIIVDIPETEIRVPEKTGKEDGKKKRKLEEYESSSVLAEQAPGVSSASRSVAVTNKPRTGVEMPLALPGPPSTVPNSSGQVDDQEIGGDKEAGSSIPSSSRNWHEAISSAKEFNFEYRYAGSQHITQDPDECLRFLLSMNPSITHWSTNGVVPSMEAFTEWARARVQAEAAGNFFFATYLQEVKKMLQSIDAPRKAREEKWALKVENEALAKRNAQLEQSGKESNDQVASLSEEVDRLKKELEEEKKNKDLLREQEARSRELLKEEARSKELLKEELEKKQKLLMGELKRMGDEHAARLERIRAFNEKRAEKNDFYMELKVAKDLLDCLESIPEVPKEKRQVIEEHLPELERLYEEVQVPKLLPGDLPSDSKAMESDDVADPNASSSNPDS